MRGLLSLLLLAMPLLSASPAQSGPWPRAEGQTYVFSGYEGGTDGWTSLYAERGLPRDLTLGLDAGGHVTPLATGETSEPVDGRARLFLRVPVLSGADRRAARPAWLEPWLIAVEISVGADFEMREDATWDTSPRYGAGLSVGRPLETRFGPGWTTLDLRVTQGGGRPSRLNAGTVVGVKPTDRLTLELGLFAEKEDTLSWAVAPTVQYRLGELGAARLGLAYKDDGATLLRVGWARSF